MKKFLLLTIAFFFTFAPTAHAAEYSYWGYWHGADGKWAMSNEGATFMPADGSVEGWRYVKTSGDEMPSEPNTAPDFQTLCADTPAEAGSKRVGVVIDYGTVEGSGSDAMETKVACALVPENADGFAVMSAVSSIVSENGMLSCVDGIPSGTCPAPEVMTTTAAPEVESKSNFNAVGLVVGITLLASAVALIRRKRSN